MALILLKSDLSRSWSTRYLFGSNTKTAGNTDISKRVGVKKDLNTAILPRTNILDSNGNVQINYDEKNKFQVPLDRSNSKLEIHWESGVGKKYYKRGLSNEDELGYRNNDVFGFDQPYVIKEIGDKWGSDVISSWDAGIIRGGAGTVAGRIAGDVQRIGKFILSPKGLAFTVKQAGLQILNVGGDLGERANIYNPISPLLNTVPLLHFKRHSDQPYSDIIREEWLDSDTVGSLGFRSSWANARFKAWDKQVSKNLLNFIGVGDGKSKLDDIEGTGKVAATGQQGAEPFEHLLREERGGFKARTVKRIKGISVDKVNLVPYGSKTTQQLKESDNNDFVPFRFKDVNNNKYIIFRALLSGITDNMTPEFAAERYVGRPDQVYVYQGTNREISFTFDIYPKTRQELPILWEKLNYLVGLVYPSWAPSGGGMGMIAPFIELTIGDMYKDTPGFLSQLSLTVQDGTTWEIDDWKLPKYIQAACSFTYIGKYLPNQIGKHYELPWLKDENEVYLGTDGIGTFSDVTPGFDSVNEFDYPTRYGKINKLFGKLGQPQ